MRQNNDNFLNQDLTIVKQTISQDIIYFNFFKQFFPIFSTVEFFLQAC